MRADLRATGRCGGNGLGRDGSRAASARGERHKHCCANSGSVPGEANPRSAHAGPPASARRARAAWCASFLMSVWVWSSFSRRRREGLPSSSQA